MVNFKYTKKKVVTKMNQIFIPSIMTSTNGHEHNSDILSYELTKSRKIYLNGEINHGSALSIIAQLNYLNGLSDDDIYLFINSPGGSVSDGLAIFDAMKYQIDCDVATVAHGLSASMGAFLLAGGTKGKRYATPNSQILIHQPLGGVSGQATDISLVAKHIQLVKEQLSNHFATFTGQSIEKIMCDIERDYWLNPAESKNYGLIDHVGFPFI